MKPNATIATGLIFTLLAGPASAQSQAPPPPQTTPTPTPVPTATPTPTPQAQPLALAPNKTISPEILDRIREALKSEPMVRIEDGQLRFFVEVVGHWPSFAEYTKGYDLMNGPTGLGNPMSHAEFVAMSTPRDLYSSAGIKPAEIVTMAAVNVVGQWALRKAITKWATSRKDKEMREIQEMIDAELAALKKAKEKEK
jgi:hypothetical protein